MSELPEWLHALLQKDVHDRIRDDPRSTTSGKFLGYTSDYVFNTAIGGGQATFDAAIGNLTGDDRVLLYARFNMRRHLDELIFAFRKLFATSKTTNRPTILDFGCGPFTAGLSFAAAMGPTMAFRYFGEDCSKCMCKLAQHFAACADEAGMLEKTSTWWFGSSLHNADFGQVNGDLTLIVMSYLIASPTFNAATFVGSLVTTLERVGPGPAAFLFTNSGHDFLNKQFPALHEELVHAGFVCKVDATETFEGTKNPKPLHYALYYHPAQLTVKLSS
jgi:hypothetical protein